jgi:hypothetical protein
MPFNLALALSDFGLVEWATANMLRPGFELARPDDMQIPRCGRAASIRIIAAPAPLFLIGDAHSKLSARESRSLRVL